MKIRTTLYALTVCFFISPLNAFGAHFQDYAQAVSPEVSDRLEKLLIDIESKKKLYIEEVILPDTGGKSIESIENTFTQRLQQNTTSVEKRVLLLIILKDRFAKLYTTANLAKIYNDKVVADILANVNERMKERRYDEMARIGVAGIYHYYQEASPSQSKKKMLTNLIFFGVAIVAALGVATLLSWRKS